MKNVLVGFDFSPLSEEALKTSAAVAKIYDAHLIVLNIIPRPPMIETAMGTIELLKKERRKKIMEKLQELGIEGEVVVSTTENSIAQKIMEIAESREADLIGLGRASMDVIEDDFIGSTVLTLKSISSIPLLITTYKGRTKFEKVLVSVSEKKDSFESLVFAVDFCKRAGCKLTILHIFETAGFEFTQAEEDRVKEIFAENLKPYLNILKEVNYEIKIKPYDTASAGIVKFAHENKMDLIIMERRKKLNLLQRLFYQSTTQRVIRASTIPVLVL